MRVPISRFGIALLLGLTVNLSACVKSGGGVTPPVATPAPSSFVVYAADLGTNDVRVVDPSSGVTLATIPVGVAPTAIAFDTVLGETPHHAFVANTGEGTVSVIDPLSNTVVKTISVCAGPHALLYHHDSDGSKYIYVACGDGTLSILSATSLTVFDSVSIGGTPIALADDPGATIYTAAVLGAEGTLSLLHYDLGRFKVVQKLAVQANPAVVSMYYGDYYVASTDGVVERFTSHNSNDPAVPFAFAEKNSSAHPFQSASALADSEVTVLADDQNGNVQLFDNGPTSGGIPGSAPIAGLAQTLNTGAGPKGAAAAAVTNGANTGSFLFVANANADSISQFSSSSTSMFTAPAFHFTSTISLAGGTHPVALAIYFKSAPTPSPSPTPTPTPTATPTPAPTSSPTSSPATAHLYIANYGGGNIAQYTSPFSSASTPSAMIADTTPVGGPVGIAANASYVVTSHVTGSAYAYQQPVSASSTPVAVFGGSAFGLMTFDAQGNLWSTSQNSSVVEYVPPFTNSTSEAKELTSGFTSSYGIAFDASGNLYVTNSDSSANIVVYAPPYTAVANTYAVATPNAALRGMAVNGSKLFVADAHNNVIYVYTLPMSTNVPADAFSATAPLGLTFDASGNLYVTSQGSNQIQVFNPPFNSGSRPAATITGGVNQAFGIAAGP